MRVSGVVVITQTRSRQECSKRVCLWDVAQSIYIVSIIQMVFAIWFFVAIALPLGEVSSNLENHILAFLPPRPRAYIPKNCHILLSTDTLHPQSYSSAKLLLFPGE